MQSKIPVPVHGSVMNLQIAVLVQFCKLNLLFWNCEHSCWNKVLPLLHLESGTEKTTEMPRLFMTRCYSEQSATLLQQRIFEKLFYALLQRCHEFLTRREFPFKNDLYSLDGTVIDLCLSLFDWAKFRKQKGAIRLHTLFCNTSKSPFQYQAREKCLYEGAIILLRRLFYIVLSEL